jgi:hypothetical protein
MLSLVAPALVLVPLERDHTLLLLRLCSGARKPLPGTG